MATYTSWPEIIEVDSLADTDTVLINGSNKVVAGLFKYSVIATGVAATDTAALQTAFTNATSGDTIILSGDFLVNAELELTSKSNINIVGKNATITQDSTLKITIDVVLCDQISITGIHFIGNGTETPWAGGSTSWNGVCGIRLNVCTNCSIDKCRFTNHAGSSVVLYSTQTNTSVTNCTMIGMGSPTIVLNDNGSDGGICSGGTVGVWTGVKIEGNLIQDHAFGIVCAFTGGGVSITGNIIYDIPGQHGVYISQGADMEFTNNVILDCALVGMKLQHQFASDVYATVIISHNTVARCDNIGLSVNGAGAALSGLEAIAYQRNVTLSNNNVYDCGYGIYFKGAKSVKCDGNRINGCSIYGLFIYNASGSFNDNYISRSVYAGLLISNAVGAIIIDGINVVDCPLNTSQVNDPARRSAMMFTDNVDGTDVYLSNANIRWEAETTDATYPIQNSIYVGANVTLHKTGTIVNESGGTENILGNVKAPSTEVYSLADADAPTGGLYYSTDQGGLTHKDSDDDIAVIETSITPSAVAATDHAAITAGIGGTVRLASGTYLLTSPISVSSPTVFEGVRGTIINIDGTGFTALSDDVVFRNIEFKSDNASDHVLTPTVAAASKLDNENWVFENCKFNAISVRFTNCSYTDSTGASIVVGTDVVDKIRITGCVFVNVVQDMALGFAAITNARVRDCTFDAIGVDTNSGDCIKVSGGSSNVLIDGCDFRDGKRDGIDVYDSQDTIVANCTFDTFPSFGYEAKHISATPPNDVIYHTVANCRFIDCGASAISMSAPRGIVSGNIIRGGVTGIRCDMGSPAGTTEFTNIIGNNVYGATNGIYASGQELNIVGNTVTDCTAYGAVLYCPDSNIVGNVFKDNAVDVYTNISGLHFSGNLVNGSEVGFFDGPATIEDGDTAITISDLQARIMTMNSSTTGRAPTVPAASAMWGAAFREGGTMQWTFINIGDQVVTISPATGHTLVGDMTLAADESGTFLSHVTGAATTVTYRL